MFLPFENISSESRIWIFSSSIKISEDSQKDISERIIKFLNSWKHHGVDLPCSFKILDAFFIIIALDQSNNSAGGCSIDQMFNCISDIDQQFDPSHQLFPMGTPNPDPLDRLLQLWQRQHRIHVA